MDALELLEEACRPLLADVQSALETLGAPPEHEVWGLLRQVGATPADAIAFFLSLDPAPLRRAGVQLRERAETYAEVDFPVTIEWEGSAGEAYGQISLALRDFLNGSLAARLDATSRYANDVAAWIKDSRDGLARALADAMGSAQAVTVRSRGRFDANGVDRSVLAAADISAWLLRAVAEAMRAGRTLADDAALVDEAVYQPPDLDVPPATGGFRLPL